MTSFQQKLREFFLSDFGIMTVFALLKLGIHLYACTKYGYFRDEFYYLACGEHLDWGYVDHPPLIGLIAKLSRILFGESLIGLRFLPAVTGAVVVFLTGYLARELGAKRFGQCLAMTGAIIAPVFLGIHNYLSMNAFDHLFWIIALCILVTILKQDQPKLWMVFGLVVGLGLQNKISILFLGFGIFAGLVLTPARKYFFNKWLWVGAALASVIFLPHILWQVSHSWPTLEFMSNAQKHKNYAYSPLEFLWGTLLESHPFSLPLLLAGLSFYFISKDGKSFRLLGWVYVAILALFIVQKAKTYYLAPALPILLAAGGVQIEQLISQPAWKALRPVYLSLLVIGGLIIAPLAIPLLPVERFISYSKALGIHGVKSENHKMGPLPQHYADMFGWENMVATVGQTYHSLSPQEQAKCGIYAQNYGEAGAIDFFGKRYGLPPAMCGHNNYFLWGMGEKPIELVIILGGEIEDHQKIFADVQPVAVVTSEYCMPYENNLSVFICRTPKVPLKSIWPKVKEYI